MQIFKELADNEFSVDSKDPLTTRNGHQEEKSGKTLLVFVYFIGFWEKPNGSRIFTPRGERFNLDQHTLSLAAARENVYVINWLEMGLEANIEPTETDTYQIAPND